MCVASVCLASVIGHSISKKHIYIYHGFSVLKSMMFFFLVPSCSLYPGTFSRALHHIIPLKFLLDFGIHILHQWKLVVLFQYVCSPLFYNVLSFSFMLVFGLFFELCYTCRAGVSHCSSGSKPNVPKWFCWMCFFFFWFKFQQIFFVQSSMHGMFAAL